MFGLQELLESTIEESLASGDLDQYPNNELESSVTDMIPGLVDDMASTQSTAESEGSGSEGSDRWPCTVPPQVGLGNCYLAVD